MFLKLERLFLTYIDIIPSPKVSAPCFGPVLLFDDRPRWREYLLGGDCTGGRAIDLGRKK